MPDGKTGLWRLSARAHGEVQGVGYRFFTRRQAAALGLRGYARNLPDGSVEVVAEGDRSALEQFLHVLQRGPSGAVVDYVDTQWDDGEGRFGSFEIRH